MLDLAELQFAEERGLHTGKVQLIIDIISKRLGSISADLERHIELLSLDQLDELGVALFDLESLDDIEAWLSRQ